MPQDNSKYFRKKVEDHEDLLDCIVPAWKTAVPGAILEIGKDLMLGI